MSEQESLQVDLEASCLSTDPICLELKATDFGRILIQEESRGSGMLVSFHSLEHGGGAPQFPAPLICTIGTMLFMLALDFEAEAIDADGDSILHSSLDPDNLTSPENAARFQDLETSVQGAARIAAALRESIALKKRE